MIRTAAITASALAALALAACQPSSSDSATTGDAASTTAPTPAPAPTPASGNVLTAEGYGPLRVGMTTAEVTAAMGGDSDPSAVGGADPASCDQWRPARAPEGTLVMMVDGKLDRIDATRGSTLKTDRGFGIGSTAAEIKTAYGDALSVEPHKYVEGAEYLTVWNGGKPTEPYVQNPAARGIRYETDATGKVTAIHVGGPSIQLVEGCA